MKNLLRKITPTFLLEWNRKRKKEGVRKSLKKQSDKGEILTKSDLLIELRNMGIEAGDSLMVHAAMSKIGFLENGPNTFIDALLETIGKTGNLLMPSSPVDKLQYDYIRQGLVFDVKNTPSKMGAISETFRKMNGVLRSAHPTEPVCALGPDAKYFVQDHFGQETPYNKKSPWYRIMEKKGKILYVGVTLINAGTNLHVLEDLVDFKYPVYTNENHPVKVINSIGVAQNTRVKVHNPVFSKKRKCDDLIPRFKKDGILKEVKLGKAHCLLLDAEGMLKSMVDAYQKNGVTMYTPNGEKIEGYD